MNSLQQTAFQWVTRESGEIGACLLALGIVYAFWGFRMYRPLLSLASILVGGLTGLLLTPFASQYVNLSPLVTGGVIGSGILALSLATPRAAATAVMAGTWGGLGWYLAQQVGLPPLWYGIVGSLAAALGAMFTLVCARSTPMVLTTLVGAVMIVVGLVGAASAYVPTFGHTFRDMAAQYGLLVPIFLSMFAVMAFSVQANQRQGDMRSGV